MNEQLQKAITDWLVNLKDVAWEQIPDLVRQYITYARISETLTATIGIALLIACPWVFFRTLRKCQKKELGSSYRRDPEPTEVAIMVLSTLLFIVGLGLALASLDSAIMAWAAPKAYALQHLFRMVVK